MDGSKRDRRGARSGARSDALVPRVVGVGRYEAARRERELFRFVGRQVRDLRLDAGLSQAAIARAADIDPGHLSRIEAGTARPSLMTLVRISLPLGAEAGVRFFAGAGPRLRDRFQAPMVEALIRGLDPRWIAEPEVTVVGPTRGVIDVVLTERRAHLIVAVEAHSELRRLEAQLRWASVKAEALPSSRPFRSAAAERGTEPEVSRLLLLRSTAESRALARRFSATLAAAYPARASDAFAALTGPTGSWPGPAIVWTHVDGSGARLLEAPPRGISVGR